MRLCLCFIFYLLSIQSFAQDLKRTYNYDYLDGFSYQGTGHIEIKQGDKNTFTIKGTERQLNNTDIHFQQGILSVKTKDPFLYMSVSDYIEGELIVKDLKKIFVTGSVSLDIDRLKGETLLIHINVPGAALVEGNIDFDRLAVYLEGGGRTVLKGKVKEEMIYIKRSGAFESQDLEAVNGNVLIEGVGTAYVHVKETLKVNITGYGHVHYVGSPRTIEDRIHGEGKISPYHKDYQPLSPSELKSE